MKTIVAFIAIIMISLVALPKMPSVASHYMSASCAGEHESCLMAGDRNAEAMPLGCLVSCLFSQTKEGLSMDQPAPILGLLAVLAVFSALIALATWTYRRRPPYEDWISNRLRSENLFGVMLLN